MSLEPKPQALFCLYFLRWHANEKPAPRIAKPALTWLNDQLLVQLPAGEKLMSPACGFLFLAVEFEVDIVLNPYGYRLILLHRRFVLVEVSCF